MSHPREDPHAYTRFVHELAERPDLVARLLSDHTGGGERCRRCPVPTGRATPVAPCSIRTLALLADAHAAEARRR